MKNKTLLLTTSLLTLGTAVPALAEVDFAKDIAPILEKRCVECHGAEKKKGKLRLDSKAEAFGKEGVLIAGKPDDSEFYLRVILPAGDDDIMPAEGEPLNKAEQDLVRAWITEGAKWPDDLVIGGGKAPEAQQVKIEWPADHKAGDAEQKAIAKLNGLGISVRPIAQNSPWLTANLRVFSGELNDDLLAALGQVAGLVDLNLASTSINDAGLAKLSGLKNLMTLHLENTAVTDAGLKHLAGMAYLNYLNLYGTAVTDAGLAQLKELKRLQKLYAWQTKATAEGAARLKESIPALAVNLGESLVVTPEKKDEEKKEEGK